MSDKSESGAISVKVIALIVAAGLVVLYMFYSHRAAENHADADAIVGAALILAKQGRGAISAAEEMAHAQASEDDMEVEEKVSAPISKLQRGSYSLTTTSDSTSTLVKVETEGKTISKGVCAAIKDKLSNVAWSRAFEKIYVLDSLRNEERDLLIQNCPYDTIHALRFYIKFAPRAEQSVEEEEPNEPVTAAPMPVSAPVTAPRRTSAPTPSSPIKRETSSAASRRPTCPAGAAWDGKRCIQRCKGNKVLDSAKGSCVCPSRMIEKEGDPSRCVDCNKNEDCSSGYQCVGNQCINEKGDRDDCRWGVCQTCEANGTRQNVGDKVGCEVGGLAGRCNGNGICYPVKGQRCTTKNGCPSGQFCNYGGNLKSSKKQKGTFGQTPNVCQTVSPQQFSYKGETYYYNSKQDLQGWCRAANNRPNCLWGYLSKVGAESWCASLGKRLLTKAEMMKVWNVLKKELPQTYKGYAYWVQEGAWVADTKGGIGFGTGHLDGYGGRGGVVCK